MNKSFIKPELSVIDNDSITIECVDQQLKSMQLGYISHCFIVKGLEDDYDLFYKANFDKFPPDVMEKAEIHALKHLENLDHLKGELLKTLPADVQQCIQGLIMIKQKGDEIVANSSKAEVMKRNISWLKELKTNMANGETMQTTSPSATPTPAKVDSVPAGVL